MRRQWFCVTRPSATKGPPPDQFARQHPSVMHNPGYGWLDNNRRFRCGGCLVSSQANPRSTRLGAHRSFLASRPRHPMRLLVEHTRACWLDDMKTREPRALRPVSTPRAAEVRVAAAPLERAFGEKEIGCVQAGGGILNGQAGKRECDEWVEFISRPREQERNCNESAASSSKDLPGRIVPAGNHRPRQAITCRTSRRGERREAVLPKRNPVPRPVSASLRRRRRDGCS